jgi:hypothetical protein
MSIELPVLLSAGANSVAFAFGLPVVPSIAGTTAAGVTAVPEAGAA